MEGKDKERTRKPHNEAAVHVVPPEPVVQEQQPAAVGAKEKEQPSQPPKPVKLDEPPPSIQVKPFEKGRESPSTTTSAKLKEAIEPAEQVEQDKKDQALHGIANVSACAHQVFPTGELLLELIPFSLSRTQTCDL